MEITKAHRIWSLAGIVHQELMTSDDPHTLERARLRAWILDDLSFIHYRSAPWEPSLSRKTIALLFEQIDRCMRDLRQLSL